MKASGNVERLMVHAKMRQHIRTRISLPIHIQTVKGLQSANLSRHRAPNRINRGTRKRVLTAPYAKAKAWFPFQHLRNLRLTNSKTSSAKRILYSFVF